MKLLRCFSLWLSHIIDTSKALILFIFLSFIITIPILSYVVSSRDLTFFFIENQFSQHGLLIHPFLQWYNMPPLSYIHVYILSLYIYMAVSGSSVLLEYLFTAVPYFFYYHGFIIVFLSNRVIS